MQFNDVKPLAYITPIANLSSILEHGILSHAQVEARRTPFVSVADREIRQSRASRPVLEGAHLNQFVNLYFNARNAMMYRVSRAEVPICVVEVNTDVLRTLGAIVSTANAASLEAKFAAFADGGLCQLVASDVYRESWMWIDGSGRMITSSTQKQRMQAELLVPKCVPPEMISAVLVRNTDFQTEKLCTRHGKPVRIDRKLFFQES